MCSALLTGPGGKLFALSGIRTAFTVQRGRRCGLAFSRPGYLRMMSGGGGAALRGLSRLALVDGILLLFRLSGLRAMPRKRAFFRIWYSPFE